MVKNNSKCSFEETSFIVCTLSNFRIQGKEKQKTSFYQDE